MRNRRQPSMQQQVYAQAHSKQTNKHESTETVDAAIRKFTAAGARPMNITEFQTLPLTSPKVWLRE